MTKRKNVGDRDQDYASLSDHEFARLRTETLFGSREVHTQTLPGFRDGKLGLYESAWVPALWTAFREVIDNAFDELIKYGHGDSVWIEYDAKTMIMGVRDNGRGMPIREVPEIGKGPAASILISAARTGRNFTEQDDLIGAGMNGLGAASVNFTSEWFDIEVDRDGTQDRDGARKLTQRWEEALKGGKIVHKTKGPHVIRGSKQRSGTYVRFCPSKQVYPKRVLPMEFVQDRVWDLAVVNPQIKVHLNGERYKPAAGTDAIIATYFPGRVASMAQIKQDKFEARFYIVPGFTDDVESSFAVVNNIPLFSGGSQVDAFRTLYTNTVMEDLKKKTKKEELVFTRDMVAQGTLIYGVTFMAAPRFDSQAKVRLVSDVASIVRAGYLESDILSMIRRNPEWVEQIIERARAKTNKKENNELARAQNRLKRSRVARLDDANHRDRSKCILFVMEGDSATGKLSDVRDNIHGILPLKGKIMNVRENKKLDVIADEALSNLMASLGLVIGQPAVRRRLRFGAIYIATDEDEDGKNITALLVNFFYTFWPELFRDGPFVYRFCTPYLIMTKGREVKYIYAKDYPEFQKNPGAYKGWSILRAKGLASLNKDAWTHVLKEPLLIPLTEDDKLESTLSLLFDKDRVEDRKRWLAGEKV